MLSRTIGTIYKIGTILAALVIIGCGGGGGGSGSGQPTTGANGFSNSGDTVAKVAIEQYVNEFVLDILNRLSNQASAFRQAVETFAADPNSTNLQSARQLWISTRIPWEESETALFGPVDFRGFDPALDSWPVNRVDLQGVLDSGFALTDASVSSLDPSLKGYHTIEFLLFGIGGSKTVEDFTEREFAYLIAATHDLQGVASLLQQSWTVGIDGAGPYAREFVSAGEGSAVYPSEQAALEEMVRGMITISDEVANGKIADPFDTRNTELVESQFSYNSISDFTSNIRGVQFGYERGLSTFVNSVDPDLDTRVRNQLAKAIAALGAIPHPFRNAILDSGNDSIIINAQIQIRELQKVLEEEVLPLVL
ncbi:MAG: hypothetical protein KDD53_01335 [Bdellovibrionales bacterium]|nr:hypothetical protein [Bdellovibrionales bacterium]